MLYGKNYQNDKRMAYERVVQKVSLNPRLNGLIQEERRRKEKTISGMISSCVEFYFRLGLNDKYTGKLKDMAQKEKRSTKDMARVIIEDHLDRVRYFKTFK